MALLAVTFRETTDVWYVDPDLPEHHARWCMLTGRSPVRVCKLRVGDEVIDAGWATVPDSFAVHELAGELGLGACMTLLVVSVSDGLAHLVLES